MKATTYKTGDRGRKAEHCDKLNAEKYVTVLSVWVKPPPMLITRRFEHCDKLKCRNYVTVVDKQGGTVTNKTPGKYVTVLVPVTEFYWKRLRMSKRKIKAVWLTVERVAELMQRSNRTVWRFVQDNKLTVHKQQVPQSGSKTVKSFLLTSPELLTMEMQNCEKQRVLPELFIEKRVEIKGKLVNSALIYQYRECQEGEEGYYEFL
ncbi:MAG: DNA-binding protein [Candidatus Cloacimonas sp.]|nr:DNA-binding protein [Candidatus Cloacimonas sp.]